MNNIKKHKKIKDIVAQYYSDGYDADNKDRMEKIFQAWYVNERDAEIKDKALYELWLKEEGNIEGPTQKCFDTVLKKCKEAVPNEQLIPETKKTIRLIPRIAAAAIMTGFIIGGILLFNLNGSKAEQITVIVPNAKIETVELYDGSKVTINSGSKITYNNNFKKAKTRTVELEGEAYFEVTENKKIPFIVKTKQMDVEVLGTTFNVEAYPERDVTSVILATGKVSINTAGNSLHTIEPYQQLVYSHTSDTEHITTLTDEMMNLALGWTTMNLAFDHLTLPQIAKVIERHYNIKVNIDSTVPLTGCYSGKINDNDSLDDIMEILQYIIPNMEYNIKDDTLTIIKR